MPSHAIDRLRAHSKEPDQPWTKHSNFEQANRIPMLIVAPGATTSETYTNQPAETVDIYPTLAELAGLPRPRDSEFCRTKTRNIGANEKDTSSASSAKEQP